MEKRTFSVGDICLSLKGHDSEKAYIIVKMDGEYAYIVNGKERKFKTPKKKKTKHLEFLSVCDIILTERIKQGQEIGNETIKKALWPYNRK